MPDRPPSISDQLRAAVRASGRSCFDLGYHACRPQLDPSLISRFVRGKRTLTLRSADSLARALGLALAPAQPEEQAWSRRSIPAEEQWANSGEACPEEQGKNREEGPVGPTP